MKRLWHVLYLILAVLLFSACANTQDDNQRETTDFINDETQSSVYTQESQKTEEQETKDVLSKDKESTQILVAYFSWAENAVQDDIDAMTSASVKVGNVVQLAEWIAEETGGDMFSIQVTESYPADWDDCLARANEEKANGTHPSLSTSLDNIDEYDVVFLGYPNWWYSCPMAIYSFLDSHDLSGKQVFLFCSHGTGGLASSVKDITAEIPDAVVGEDVFHVYQDDTASAKEDVLEWVNNLELKGVVK